MYKMRGNVMYLAGVTPIASIIQSERCRLQLSLTRLIFFRITLWTPLHTFPQPFTPSSTPSHLPQPFTPSPTIHTFPNHSHLPQPFTPSPTIHNFPNPLHLPQPFTPSPTIHTQLHQGLLFSLKRSRIH